MLDFLSSSFLGESVSKFVHETGFAQLFLQEGGYKYLIMIAVGCFFLYLAIKHKFEPMLLVPIGFGIIIGNIPMVTGHGIGIYEEGSVLNYLYFGVRYGVYPPLIFLGVGAMTDFSSLISNPKLMLIGAAAQIGIFAAYMGALALGFPANEAGSIAIIGGATAFIESTLAQIYKRRNTETGESYGGPAYYIEAALHSRPLAMLFALSLIATYAGGFNMLCSYNLQSTFSGYSFYSPEWTPWIIGGIVALLTGYGVMGGGKRIIKFTSTLVPFMGGLYVLVWTVWAILSFTGVVTFIYSNF